MKHIRDGKTRRRQLFMNLRKLENTANWKRKCVMAIFAGICCGRSSGPVTRQARL